MLATLNDDAAKEILVMWEKAAEVPSLTPIEEMAPPVVSVSVPQEKSPAFQRSLLVAAVLQAVNPEPNNCELEE